MQELLIAARFVLKSIAKSVVLVLLLDDSSSFMVERFFASLYLKSGSVDSLFNHFFNTIQNFVRRGF